jgi:hypothetical protein
MIVDCRTCPVRGQGCDDCVVTVLLGAPGSVGPPPAADPQIATGLALDAAESRVVSIFVGAGLVQPAAVAGLRARRERGQSWEAVRNVG